MNGTLPDLSLTIPLVVAIVLALLILGTLVRFGSMASMRRMGMSLAIGAALFWGTFAIGMLWGFWDSYYQYFYDDRARKWAWTAALLYAAVGLALWWLATHLPGNKILNFLLLGGVESVPEHILGIYVFRILDRVPDLQGISREFIFIFAFFEYIVYWGIVLALALLIQRLLTGARIRMRA